MSPRRSRLVGYLHQQGLGNPSGVSSHLRPRHWQDIHCHRRSYEGRESKVTPRVFLGAPRKEGDFPLFYTMSTKYACTILAILNEKRKSLNPGSFLKRVRRCYTSHSFGSAENCFSSAIPIQISFRTIRMWLRVPWFWDLRDKQ